MQPENVPADSLLGGLSPDEHVARLEAAKPNQMTTREIVEELFVMLTKHHSRASIVGAFADVLVNYGHAEDLRSAITTAERALPSYVGLKPADPA